MSDRREKWLMNQAKASLNESEIADLIGKRQLTSDEINAPAVYHFMNNFIPSAIVNPQARMKIFLGLVIKLLFCHQIADFTP